MKHNLHLLSGALFAKEFNRVVHGERGDYVEFSKDQILLPLKYYFSNNLKEQQLFDLGHYYVWLYPEFHRNTKVYKQLRTVKYADYKVGMYYLSPSMFLNFKDPELLF
jgi:hypothetical protein